MDTLRKLKSHELIVLYFNKIDIDNLLIMTYKDKPLCYILTLHFRIFMFTLKRWKNHLVYQGRIWLIRKEAYKRTEDFMNMEITQTTSSVERSKVPGRLHNTSSQVVYDKVSRKWLVDLRYVTELRTTTIISVVYKGNDKITLLLSKERIKVDEPPNPWEYN